MARRKKDGDEVGYGRPPKEHRFSKTNQPTRTPRYVTHPGKTMTEMASEKRAFKSSNGESGQKAPDDLIVDAWVQKAAAGDMKLAKMIFERSDAEEDEAARNPPPNDRDRAVIRKLAESVAPYVALRDHLVALGLIADILGDLRVTRKAKHIGSVILAAQSTQVV